MGREFCPMAIRSIPGFSSQKALDRGLKIPQARSSALWAPFTTMRPSGSLLRSGLLLLGAS
jgi:hypothetical protein